MNQISFESSLRDFVQQNALLCPYKVYHPLGEPTDEMKLTTPLLARNFLQSTVILIARFLLLRKTKRAKLWKGDLRANETKRTAPSMSLLPPELSLSSSSPRNEYCDEDDFASKNPPWLQNKNEGQVEARTSSSVYSVHSSETGDDHSLASSLSSGLSWMDRLKSAEEVHFQMFPEQNLSCQLPSEFELQLCVLAWIF